MAGEVDEGAEVVGLAVRCNAGAGLASSPSEIGSADAWAEYGPGEGSNAFPSSVEVDDGNAEPPWKMICF